MTMTSYQVDSEAVLSATSAVRTTVERLQGEVATLQGQLGTLQGSWTGQAAAAFQSIVTEWTSTQHRVEENLSAISHALGVAGQQYAEIEAANARLFSH
jgi:WXG100 family type VII secretion target